MDKITKDIESKINKVEWEKVKRIRKIELSGSTGLGRSILNS